MDVVSVFIALGIFFASYFVVAFLISVTLGGILELGIESFGALLWKTAVLALCTGVAALAAAFVPLPFVGLVFPAVATVAVLIGLYDMDPAEEWKYMAMFVVIFLIGSGVVQFLAFGALESVMSK